MVLNPQLEPVLIVWYHNNKEMNLIGSKHVISSHSVVKRKVLQETLDRSQGEFNSQIKRMG